MQNGQRAASEPADVLQRPDAAQQPGPCNVEGEERGCSSLADRTARHHPIIFASGDNPVPLALMGLNEGVNVFVDDEGKVTQPIYIPAYVRRYPFLLAKLNPNSEELSLCFDPSANLLGDSL